MRDKLNRFMAGRYGNDSLNRFLLGAAFVCLILSWFVVRGVFSFLTLFLLFYTYYRARSRNVAARAAENDRYLHVTERIRRLLRVNKLRFQQRNTYRFFKCPGCGQQVRVPKGRGRIMITCPKCRVSFEKTT